MIGWVRQDAWIDLLELALVVVLAVGLAHWTWLAASPRVVSAPGSLVDATAARMDAVAAGRLFGLAKGASPGPVRTAGTPHLVLLGVLSGPDKSGRAILAGQGTRPVIVAPGEMVDDNTELLEVHEDHVVVRRAGAPERIELERGAKQAAPQPAAVRAPARR